MVDSFVDTCLSCVFEACTSGIHQNVLTNQIALFLGSMLSTERGNSNGTSRRANEGVKALKLSVKAENVS
jgi:hypothetical protein